MADTTPPNPMTGLTVSPGDVVASLAWNATLDADRTSVLVYRDATLVSTLAPDATTYLDTGLTNGTEYGYTLTAKDAAGNESVPTAEVLATPGTGTAYCTTGDLQQFRGQDAANTDSNTYGGSTAEPPSYRQAIGFGCSELDRLAVGLGISVPMVTDVGSPAAFAVNMDATILSLYYLYWKRPAEGSTKNVFDKLRESVLARWKDYRIDPSLLPAGFELSTGGYDPSKIAAPFGLYPTVNQDGRTITASNHKIGIYWDSNGRQYRAGW